jgi:hypothetical protein
MKFDLKRMIRQFLLKGDFLYVVLPLMIISLFFGIYIHYPVSITYDPAMHGEIVNIILHQGYPNTWEPYANNEFTYTPLFHYLSLVPHLLGLSVIDSVMAVGIILWAFLPLCAYLLGSLYGRKIALLSAAVSALLPFFSNIFILGEFPQLLAMELLILEIYFLKKGKLIESGIITGLVILSHPFIWIVSVLAYLYFLVPSSLKNRKNIPYILVPVAVSSVWLPKYFQIFMNMLSGEWENIVFNAEQPNFWFWSLESLSKYLFDLNYFTPVIIILSFIGLLKTRDRFMQIFFVSCFILSVYHIPYTQLKVLDLLTIPSIFLTSIGVKEISNYFKKYGLIVLAAFVIVMFSFQAYHFYYADKLWFNSDISPEPPLYQASVWLGNYDKNPARIYVDSAPAWVGILSSKIPLEPQISYLERFSRDYLNQLELRNAIKERLESGENITDLTKGIKYLITRERTNLNEIYFLSGWFIYEV